VDLGRRGTGRAQVARLAAAAAVAASFVATTTAWLAVAALALADSPTPSQADIGDPRAGQAATLAGNPAFAIVVVALIAIVAVVATLVWVRATGGPAETIEDR
jgi:hypothetical protein